MTKILKKCKESKEIFVVGDQIGSPTYTRDFAISIRSLIGKINQPTFSKGMNAVYHVTNGGYASRCDIAQELARQTHFDSTKVIPIDSAELKSIAKRPLNSSLNGSRFQNTFGITMRSWQEALKDYLEEIGYHDTTTAKS